MTDQDPSILRPIPRRHFEITPASSGSSTPASPPDSNPNYLQTKANKEATSSSSTPSRTRSILNLTSSTLFGIYSSTEPAEKEEISTPWGTGAQTPSQRKSEDDVRPVFLDAGKQYDRRRTTTPNGQRPQSAQRRSPSRQLIRHKSSISRRVLRTTLLFTFGIAYGVIITHLHDDQRLAPVRVEGIDRNDWRYLVFWGVAGVALGSLLPVVDVMWADNIGNGGALSENGRSVDTIDHRQAVQNGKPTSKLYPSAGGLGADWNPVVRSIGAFVGIAFAIRKLPWQSTLQVSLTLAMVNPVLWYLLDRSKPGFMLSSVVGLTGTLLLIGINPDIVPAPATPLPHASALLFRGSPLGISHPTDILSAESISVGTWIASVLFCSCICFGNIGRRLAGSEKS
ncbi:MAG: hypothetical protein M1833_007216 [Piccolia ochrophora]|nr:MAG: hypothetical protein M1833_007216 [Piccolia ochrophora]